MIMIQLQAQVKLIHQVFQITIMMEMIQQPIQLLQQIQHQQLIKDFKNGTNKT